MEQKNTPPPSQVSEEEFKRVFEIVDEKPCSCAMEDVPATYLLVII